MSVFGPGDVGPALPAAWRAATSPRIRGTHTMNGRPTAIGRTTAGQARGDRTTDDETAVTGRTAHAAQPTLARVLSGRMLLFLVLGDVLGSGIYALTGQIAADVGGMIWAPFLIAFALAFLTGTAYAELVGKYPRAAGAALYANEAFRRPFLTFMVGFTVLAAGITSTATAARAIGGKYLAEFVAAPTVVVAVVFILLTAVLNARGIGESARVNLVLTVIELTGLLLIVGIGVHALATGAGEPGRAFELRAEGPAPLALLAGTTLAFYAMLGFENSVNLVEEARRPRRDLPRALFGGMFIAGTVYLFVAFTCAMLVDPDILTGSGAPLLEVVKASDVPVPSKLFAAVALVAVANTALMNMVMASRLVYGMAAQGTIPTVFARVLPGRRTPPIAIGFVTALTVALSSTGQLAGLADTTVLLLLLVFFVVNTSALVLRREPVPPGAYRAPTWAPALGALSCAALATPLVHREGTVYLRALGLLALAAVLILAQKVVSGRFRACELSGAARPPRHSSRFQRRPVAMASTSVDHTGSASHAFTLDGQYGPGDPPTRHRLRPGDQHRFHPARSRCRPASRRGVGRPARRGSGASAAATGTGAGCQPRRGRQDADHAGRAPGARAHRRRR